MSVISYFVDNTTTTESATTTILTMGMIIYILRLNSVCVLLYGVYPIEYICSIFLRLQFYLFCFQISL